MAKDDKGLEVKIGDAIEVASSGIVVRGKVATVDWYFGDGWQIEITEANIRGGYSSWKQRYDGGRITKLNGVSV